MANSRTLMLVLILIVFTTTATAYSFVVPVFEAPDENDHLARINYYYSNHTLGDANLGWLPIGIEPPLYHAALAALLYLTGLGSVNLQLKWHGYQPQSVAVFDHSSADRDLHSPPVFAFHLLRLVSVCMGAGTVVAAYLTARVFFKKRSNLALLAAAVTAFIPQFTFIASAVNYDSMVSLFSTLMLYYLAKELTSANFVKKGSLSCGVMGGAAMLTKFTGGFVMPVAALGLLGKRLIIKTRDGRELAANSGILFGTIMLLSGWFYVRNFLLYGAAVVQPATSSAEHQALLISYFTGGSFFRVLFASFWFYFGWMSIQAPLWVYVCLALFSGLAIAGLAFSIAESYVKNKTHFLVQIMFLAAGLMVFAGVVYFNLHYLQPQGRYLFPAIAPISILTIEGLAKTSDRIMKNQYMLPALMVAFLLMIDIGGLLLLTQVYNP